MPLSQNVLKTIIRRAYVLNASGCVVQSIAAFGKRVVGGNGTACKMLQTFEDCVFQQKIDKRFASFMDYDKHIPVDDVATKCYQKNQKNTMNLNKNTITLSAEHMGQQQQQQLNHLKEYEVSKKKKRTKENIINIRKKRVK